MCVCVCVCVCVWSVCLSSLVCVVGVIFVCIHAVYGFCGYSFFYAWLDVSAWLFGHLLFWVSYMHMFCIFFCICTCSAQQSMFHMERRSRNPLIITINIKLTTQPMLPHSVCTERVITALTHSKHRHAKHKSKSWCTLGKGPKCHSNLLAHMILTKPTSKYNKM